MPTATSIETIDWNTSLPGADPYLVWASLSKLRDFRMRNDRYQIAVETRDATNPCPIPVAAPGQPPQAPLGLRTICGSGLNGGQFLVGTVNEGQLIALAERSDIKLEFNVARQKAGAATSGVGVRFADQPKLGKSVIAVIDFGCPFAHQQFLTNNANKTSSRVRFLWDQEPLHTVSGVSASDGFGEDGSWWYPVKDYQYGREITSPVMEKLFAACTSAGVLDEDKVYAAITFASETSPLDARSTHGSHVLDLAAGRLNPMAETVGTAVDAASGADIIFVQLPKDTTADTSGGSMTMYALDALTYIFNKTKEVEHLVINISYGSTAGPHDGSSMLERAMDCLISAERTKRNGKNIEVVLPAGNHFLAQGHASVTLNKKSPQGVLNWQVMPDDATDTFAEIWYELNNGSSLEVALISPCGRSRIAAQVDNHAVLRNAVNEAIGAIIHSASTPNGAKNMALVVLAPTHTYRQERVEHGVWKIELTLTNQTDADITVNAWVERDDPLRSQQGQPQTYFLSTTTDRQIDSLDTTSDPVKRQTTGSSLANGTQSIVVGGYVRDSKIPVIAPTSFDLSAYSAAGPTGNAARTSAWPSYVAPSDESASLSGVLAAGACSGILVRMNGTSVAAPQVARQLLNTWSGVPPVPTLVRGAVAAPVGDIRDQRGIGSHVIL